MKMVIMFFSCIVVVCVSAEDFGQENEFYENATKKGNAVVVAVEDIARCYQIESLQHVMFLYDCPGNCFILSL